MAPFNFAACRSPFALTQPDLHMLGMQDGVCELIVDGGVGWGKQVSKTLVA